MFLRALKTQVHLLNIKSEGGPTLDDDDLDVESNFQASITTWIAKIRQMIHGNKAQSAVIKRLAPFLDSMRAGFEFLWASPLRFQFKKDNVSSAGDEHASVLAGSTSASLCSHDSASASTGTGSKCLVASYDMAPCRWGLV